MFTCSRFLETNACVRKMCSLVLYYNTLSLCLLMPIYAVPKLRNAWIVTNLSPGLVTYVAHGQYQLNMISAQLGPGKCYLLLNLDASSTPQYHCLPYWTEKSTRAGMISLSISISSTQTREWLS